VKQVLLRRLLGVERFHSRRRGWDRLVGWPLCV